MAVRSEIRELNQKLDLVLEHLGLELPAAPAGPVEPPQHFGDGPDPLVERARLDAEEAAAEAKAALTPTEPPAAEEATLAPKPKGRKKAS